jgi:hypothetical protein
MLVSAPAGFGKTTLLAQWLAACPARPTNQRSAAWLSLDQGENDPASFWTYLIAALRTVAPGRRFLSHHQPKQLSPRLMDLRSPQADRCPGRVLDVCVEWLGDARAFRESCVG